MRKKQKIFDKTVFCLGMGSFLLLIWFLWREPLQTAKKSDGTLTDALEAYFIDYTFFYLGIALLLVGLAGFVKLNFFKDK